MTKIPTEILKLAQQGGYELPIQFKGGSRVGEIKHDLMVEFVVALDREFWIGLGKKLGWKVVGTGPHSTDHNDQWFYEAQEFLEFVLCGQDPTEYWAQLTK